MNDLLRFALRSGLASTLADVTQHLAAVQRLMSERTGVAPAGLGAAMPAEEAARWRR